MPGVREVSAPDGTPPPRYNIAPTQQVPLVRFDEHVAQLDSARWGLLPPWKKDEMLYAAALWETGLGKLSTTMVTTESAGHIAWLHDRLPLFLRREEIEQWVHGTPKDAVELVRPSRVAQDLFWRPSAQEVGNVRNDYAELMGDGAMGKQPL